MTQICHNCGTRSDVPSRFCTTCGTPMAALEQATSVPPASDPPPPQDAGTRNRLLIIGAVALVCVAIVGAATAVLVSSSGKDGTRVVTAAARPPAQTAAQQTQTVVTVVQPSPSSEQAPDTSGVPTPTTVAKASIKRVIRRHWANVESGSYAAAFAALAPGTQSRGSWIEAHQQDALAKARISLGAPQLTSSTTATVPVLSLHTEAASGCNDWTGHYEMVKLDGAWKINKAKITNSPC